MNSQLYLVVSFNVELCFIYLLFEAFQKNWIPVSPHVGNFKVGGELENRCGYQKKSGKLTKTAYSFTFFTVKA